MVDPIYPIPGNPVYSPEIRALQDGDPARASTVFNPVLEKIISNTHAVKLAGDGLAKSVKALAEAATDSPAFTGTPTAPTPTNGDSSTKLATTAFVKNQDYIPSADKGKALGVASLGANGKVLTSQLPEDIDCGTF